MLLPAKLSPHLHIYSSFQASVFASETETCKVQPCPRRSCYSLCCLPEHQVWKDGRCSTQTCIIQKSEQKYIFISTFVFFSSLIPSILFVPKNYYLYTWVLDRSLKTSSFRQYVDLHNTKVRTEYLLSYSFHSYSILFVQKI